ncbi:hypothetical protein AVEN_274334-1, partial [Araneus ventricosus]
MSCFLKPKIYFDIEALKESCLPIDKLIEPVVSKHKERLKAFRTRNTVWRNVYNVTPALVKAFETEAYAHVKHISDNIHLYGYFYHVMQDEWMNEAYFDVESFQMVENRWEVLSLVKKQALIFSKPDTHRFDATCLYL